MRNPGLEVAKHIPLLQDFSGLLICQCLYYTSKGIWSKEHFPNLCDYRASHDTRKLVCGFLSSLFPIVAFSGIFKRDCGLSSGEEEMPRPLCNQASCMWNREIIMENTCWLCLWLQPLQHRDLIDLCLTFDMWFSCFCILQPALPMLFLKYANNFLWNNWPAHLKMTRFLFQPFYRVLFD